MNLDLDWRWHKNVLRFVLAYVLLSHTALHAQQRANVLELNQTSLDAEASSSLPNEKQLRDAKDTTAVKIELTANESVNLVYAFDGQTVTVESVGVRVPGNAAPKATVEVLVSTLSATSGFRSVRVEPLSSKKNQRRVYRFEPAAAKWIMVRLQPVNENTSTSFSISELELNGYLGIPKSTYLFDESPADAIQVLSRLSDSINVELSKDEERLFQDASDGKLDDVSFAEASLLSSGVADSDRRKAMLAKIQQLESQFKQTLPAGLPPLEIGKRLLAWLHAGPLNQGYSEQQTDVSVALERQTFNCVSSATLYNILARRLGLDARGIEVPDHAFSILYDGTKHVDIETTNQYGFNPARNRQAIERFQRTTGFVYIPEANRSKRREVGDAGMVALTYYNHGVTALKEQRFADAMVGFFKALSLDSKNKSAVKNILGTLGKWTMQLYDSGEIERALAVLEVGRDLAPKDRGLKHNHLAVWQKHVKNLVEGDRGDEALTQLASAYQRTQDNELAELQSWVYVLRGRQLMQGKQWEAVITNVEDGLRVVNEAARKDLKQFKHYVLFKWSSELMDRKQFSEAVDVVERGLTESSDWRLNQRLGYLAQEWSRHESKLNGVEAGHLLLNKLAQRFPKNYQLKQVASALTNNSAKDYVAAKDYESALKVYQHARKLNPNNWQINKNEKAIWSMMARPHLDAREWRKAADIYERACQSMPNEFGFKQNLAYVTQELGKDELSENGIVAAEEVIAEMAKRFPQIAGIQSQRGSLIHNEVLRLIKAHEFDTAETLLKEHPGFWRYKHERQKMETHLFYQQASPTMNAKQWEDTIAIFTKGVHAFPDNRQMKTNLEFAWMQSAKELLDTEKWEQAVSVYEEASAALPNSFKIKKNLRYCRAKLEKANE